MAFGVRRILWDIERAYPRVFYPSGISFLRLLFLSLFSWVRPSTRLFTGFVVASSPERAKCASFVENIRVIPATQTSSPFVGDFASTYLTFDVLVFARVSALSGSILAAGSASFFFNKFSWIEALLENNAAHAHNRFRNGDSTYTPLLKGACQANGNKE